MIVFGAPLAEHTSNKVVTTILAGLGVGALWLAVLDTNKRSQDWQVDFAIHIAFAVLFAALAVWIFRLGVVLHAEGVSYSNLLGEKQMRWDDVAQFYYRATKRRVNFIPIGTYYSFKLIDTGGQKISFGSGLARPAALGTKLIEMTRGPLLKRAADSFDAGADVDFGPVRINRQSGMTVKKSWGRSKHIPWNEVHSYAIQQGHFYIWRVGEKRATGLAIATIPNAFVLLGILNAIFKPSEQKTGSG